MTVLADGWVSEPLSEVATFNIGRTPARANASYWLDDGETVPWVAISDMKQHEPVVDTAERISGAAFRDVFRQRVIPAGTLLMSFKLTIGRVSFLATPACHNEAIISIFPRDNVDPRYLAYYLSQLDYASHHDRQIKGNTLNRAKLERMPVCLPSNADEQRAIADVLDHVREAIRAEKAALAAADDMKQSAMQHLFTRGRQGEATKESELGPVPESWIVDPLGELGKIGNGSTPKKSVAEFWDGGSFPWLTSAKVYDREITAADQFVTPTALRDCHLPVLAPGAVLVAITGQGKTLGHCAELQVAATISQHLAYVQTDTDRILPRFLRYYLETQYDYLRQIASGGGSTKGALTCAFLRTLPVAYPADYAEQAAIVAILNAADRKIAIHRERHGLLEQLFAELLHQLISQEIRVGDLDLSGLTEHNPSELQAGAPA